MTQTGSVPFPRNFGRNNNLGRYRAQLVPPESIIELTIRQGCHRCYREAVYITHHIACETLTRAARYLIERTEADGDSLSTPNGFNLFTYLLDSYSEHDWISRCQCASHGWQTSTVGLQHFGSAIFSGQCDDLAWDYLSIRIWPMSIYENQKPTFIPSSDSPDVLGIRVGMNTPAGLPFSLAICGLPELFSQLRRSRPTHVVTIADVGVEPFEFPTTTAVLALNFYDVEDDWEIRTQNLRPDEIPNHGHAKAILSFAASLPPFSRVLVQCTGISRSTAAAALIVAQFFTGNEDLAIDAVRKIRPQAAPNRRLLQAGDDLLRCGGRLVRSTDF